MAKKKKKVPGLNSSSTADISFILLIFFLITTSMDTDMGLARRLPRPPEPDQEDATMDVKSRNILYVRLNQNGELWVKNEIFNSDLDVSQLRTMVKDFVKNEGNLSKLPEKNVVNINLLGQCVVTNKHVISVQTDRATPYDIYFQVQNEIVAAYNELRNELAKQKFGRTMDALTEEEAQAIRDYYPQKISEAEPKKYEGV